MDQPLESLVEVSPAQGVIGYDRDLMRGTLQATLGAVPIGVILDGGSDWVNGDKPAHVEYRVLYTGPGLPTPDEPFAHEGDAVRAIVETRRAYRAWLDPGTDGLTEFDRRALRFEATPEAQATDGRREKKIGELFHGMHPSAYAVQLAALLRERRNAAQAANPAAVAVLDRRARRRRTRRRTDTARGNGGRPGHPTRVPPPRAATTTAKDNTMSRIDHPDTAAKFAEKAERIAARSDDGAAAITYAILALYNQLAETTEQGRSGLIDLGNELNDIKDGVDAVRDVAVALETGDPGDGQP